jgi:hypothetical protein
MRSNLIYLFVFILLTIAFSCKKDPLYTKDDGNIDSLYISFPNSFTPNYNGNDDTYKPFYKLGVYTNSPNPIFIPASQNPIKFYSLEIRDLSNYSLFETTNIEKGWNGEANGWTVPNGTYLVFIHIEGTRNQVINLNKQINLFR